MQTWLIGAGAMAQDYLKVLQALGVPVKVVSRGGTSVIRFEQETGQAVDCDLQTQLVQCGPPEQAIVAVNIESLALVATQLMEAGTKRILLEKPGALDLDEIRRLEHCAQRHGARVLIGYNRRFYASTIAARQIIEEDGGACSCRFEFTEWAHTIVPLALDPRVKQHWVIGNSSHVIDLSFHLCGLPDQWSSYHGGRLDWHESAARFTGAGTTSQGVFFSYFADWEVPGRWAVEIATRKRRLIFSPMEKLHITRLASTKVELAPLNYGLDEDFKPGLYLQVDRFLKGVDAEFCKLSDQVKNFENYYRIAGYL